MGDSAAAGAYMSIRLTNYQQQYGSLGYAEPAPGVLEIILAHPQQLNALDQQMHRDLAWCPCVLTMNASMAKHAKRKDYGQCAPGARQYLLPLQTKPQSQRVHHAKEAGFATCVA
jgi:hypothetical protein